MEEKDNQYTNGAANNNGVYYQPPAESNENNDNNAHQYYQQNADISGVYQQPVIQQETPKKKGKAGKFIGIIAAILVVIFAVLFVIGLNSDDADSDGTSSTAIDSQAEEQEDDDKDAGKKITYGVFTDDTYTNEFAELGVKLPDSDWKFLSSDELCDLLSANNPQTDESGEIYIESSAETAYYDLMMLNNTTGTNIQVVLSKTNAVAGVLTSEDLYISNATSSITNSSTTTISDTYSLNIAQQEYKAVDVEYTAYGTKQTIAVRKTGKNFVCIIVTVYENSDSNESAYYTDMFYKF